MKINIMTRLVPWLAGAMIFLSAPVLAQVAQGPKPLPYKGPAVEMCVEFSCAKGHGSGVYLGRGYFLTAKHVSVHATNGILFAKSNGSRYKLQQVWDAGGSDISLYKSTEIVNIRPASLSCQQGQVDESIYLEGNPGPLHDIKTIGIVAGFETKIDGVSWENFIVGVIPSFGGYSGGPVMDMADHKVLGLLVGGMGDSAFSVIEPTYKVCSLLPAEIAPK